MLGATSLLAVICILAQASKLCAQRCLDDAYNKCERKVTIRVEEIADQQQTKMEFPNEDFLNKYCDEAKILSDCIFQNRKQCQHEYKYNELEELLAFIKNTTNQICNKTSEFRKVYLNNVDCVNGNMQYFSQCVGGTWDFLQSVIGKYDELSRDDYELRSCMRYYIDKNVCVLGLVDDNCGVEAGNFIRKIIQDIPMDKDIGCSKNMFMKIRDTYGEAISKWQWYQKE